jgi:hypothetical protein
MATTGFAPSFYYAQNTAGVGIWVATGSISGIQVNGQFVSLPNQGTTLIWVTTAGQIGTGAAVPSGAYAIARVVTGLVVTSGNTVNSTPWGGAAGLNSNPLLKASYNNSISNPGVLSITDLRT